MTPYVWDASTLLLFLRREPGLERLEAVLDTTADHLLSTVNLAEVASWFSERGMPVEALREFIAELDLDTVAFDSEMARLTGELRAPTRHLGLSLGDRACLALAKSRSAVALTADRVWRDLDIGVTIECIR